MIIAANIRKIKQQIPKHVQLVAVSKTKPVELLMEAYHAGQRAFGENRVQELLTKQPLMPDDVEWHLIGHLQTNKVKYIAPFIHLIQSVDSLKLLETINKVGEKNKRVINVLIQVFIAKEETKFGLNEDELHELLVFCLNKPMQHICICGLMGIATNTEDKLEIIKEFNYLKGIFDNLKSNKKYEHILSSNHFNLLSMGMSSDYDEAINSGSNIVRVGSAIFGNR